MFTRFDYDLVRRESALRNAESNAVHFAALRADRRDDQSEPTRRGLWTMLRRIAGTPAAA